MKKKNENTKSVDNVEAFAPVNMKKRRIIIIAAAVVALLAIAAGIIIPIVINANKKNFDYVSADLTKYVEFTSDKYKNYKLEVDIAKPKDIDPDVAMLNMLSSDKEEKPLYDGAFKTTEPVTPGDVVNIWYRGYLLDDEGKELVVAGMCNYANASPTALTIGTGQFVPGFELSLLGKLPNGNKNFKITSGTVKEGQIAYVSYSILEDGKDEKKDKKKLTSQRVVLSDEEALNKTFGEGFKANILGADIGTKMDFDAKRGGKTYHYTDLTVDFVTEREADAYTVECYFPYDYSSATLANQTAYFEVTIVNTQVYKTPSYTYAPDANGKNRFNLTNEYVEKKVAEEDSPITMDELMEYEGEELWQKYRAYAEDYLNDAYEKNLRAKVEDAMWTYYLKNAKIIKYPENKVDEIYREYYDDVLYQFDYTGGSISLGYDLDGDGMDDTETYDNVDDFAEAYLGIYNYDESWQEVLRGMSEDLVAERLVLYYLMQVENLTPTEEVLATRLAEVKQEYIDEYLLQYSEEFEIDLSKYTEEEYAKYVEDRKLELFEYYDEAYFLETTYYEIVLDTLLTWPTVITMDEGESKLPQTK